MWLWRWNGSRPKRHCYLFLSLENKSTVQKCRGKVADWSEISRAGLGNLCPGLRAFVYIPRDRFSRRGISRLRSKEDVGFPGDIVASPGLWWMGPSFIEFGRLESQISDRFDIHHLKGVLRGKKKQSQKGPGKEAHYRTLVEKCTHEMLMSAIRDKVIGGNVCLKRICPQSAISIDYFGHNSPARNAAMMHRYGSQSSVNASYI